jgi:hypothetical protein
MIYEAVLTGVAVIFVKNVKIGKSRVAVQLRRQGRKRRSSVLYQERYELQKIKCLSRETTSARKGRQSRREGRTKVSSTVSIAAATDVFDSVAEVNKNRHGVEYFRRTASGCPSTRIVKQSLEERKNL